MLEQAEARVKIGMDDTSVKVGLEKSVGDFNIWSEGAKESVHKIHNALTGLRHALHLFGAMQAITALMHLVHFGHKLKEALFDSNEEMRKIIETAKEGVDKIYNQLRRSSQIHKEEAKLDRMKATGASPDEIQIQQSVVEYGYIRDRELAKAHADFKENLEERAREKAKSGKKEDVEELGKAEKEAAEAKLAYEESDLALFKFQTEQKKEAHEEEKKKQKEELESYKKAAHQAFEEQQEWERERHEEKMRHLEEERIKTSLANEIARIERGEQQKFQPSEKQLLGSGTWWHNKFRPSWASRTQSEINDLTEGIQSDLARFGMSDDIKSRMKYVDKLRNDLGQFTGSQNTPEAKIAEATRLSEEHLGFIRKKFENPD